MKSKSLRNRRDQDQIFNRRNNYGVVDYTRIGRDPKQVDLKELINMGNNPFCDFCRKNTRVESALQKVQIGEDVIGEACLTCSSALKTSTRKVIADAEAVILKAQQQTEAAQAAAPPAPETPPEQTETPPQPPPPPPPA